MSITQIDPSTIHQLCSSQVIADLTTALKELIENSIDAGTKSLTINLENYGLDLLEVLDDGTGVASKDYQGLTQKYHTSKISSFQDIFSVKTLGFRGEALASLCATGNLSVCTKTDQDATGMMILYDHEGRIVSETPCSRTVGTTVSVRNIFKSLPVRRAALTKNIKSEYSAILTMIYSYVLINPYIKFIVTHSVVSNGKLKRDCPLNIIPMPTPRPSLQNSQIPRSSSAQTQITPPNPSSTQHPQIDSTTTSTPSLTIATAPLTSTSPQLNPLHFNSTSLANGIVQIYSQQDFDKLEFFSYFLDISDINAIHQINPPQINNSAVHRTLSNNNGPTPPSTLLPTIHQSHPTTSQASAHHSKLTLSDLQQPQIPAIDYSQIDFAETVEIAGYISKLAPKCGRTTADRQFVFLNGRPIDHPAILKTLSTTYKQFSIKGGVYNNSGSFPNIFLTIKTAAPHDINLSPNKRTVFLHGDQAICALIRDIFVQKYEANENIIPANTNGTQQYSSKGTNAGAKPTSIFSSFSNTSGNQLRRNTSGGQVSGADTEVSQKKVQKKTSSTFFSVNSGPPVPSALPKLPKPLTLLPPPAAMLRIGSNQGTTHSSPTTSSPPSITTSTILSAFSTISEQTHLTSRITQIIPQPHTHQTSLDPTNFDDTDSSALTSNNSSRQLGIGTPTTTITTDRTIMRGDFNRMHVIGQFNRGFILVRLPTLHTASSPHNQHVMQSPSKQRFHLSDDIFIVDQHASDEKYNYETLLHKAKISQQPLLLPKPLHLPSKHLLFLLEHLTLFKRIGFDIRLQGPQTRSALVTNSLSSSPSVSGQPPTTTTTTTTTLPTQSHPYCSHQPDPKPHRDTQVAQCNEDAYNEESDENTALEPSRLPVLALFSQPSYYKLLLDQTDISTLCEQLINLPSRALERMCERLLIEPSSSGLQRTASASSSVHNGCKQIPSASNQSNVLSFFEIYRQFWVKIHRLDTAIASRSCRMSIMIGDALSGSEMTQLVHKLHGLHSPWACPHGRPTLRFLWDLSTRPLYGNAD